ncbi:hypothetical protein BDZ91DRAFT_737243 [Kalaharituber pfeilii]|nr:hypothetical protein BDZ91DRAFT_737243 [Kalaharituber pfeilii]
MRQGRKPFRDFLEEFYSVARLAGIEDEEEKLSELRIALSPKMTRALATDQSTTLKGFIETALIIESRLSSAASQQRPRRQRGAYTQATIVHRAKPKDTNVELCFNCGGTNHWARQCPESRTSPPPKPPRNRRLSP